MRILSIHDGHTATACYLEAGRPISMVSEERFTGVKNQGGFPEYSVRWILEDHSLSFDDIDYIVFPHLISPIDYGKTYGGHHSYRHKLFHILDALMPRAIIGSDRLIGPYVRAFRGFRRRTLYRYAGRFGFQASKICQVEHHTAHGYGALYGSGFAEDGGPVLVFTMDGSGDGVSSRVATWDGSGEYRKLHESSSFHSVGELYSRVTQFMGMRAGEHEYKLMGMAPYVPQDKSERVFRKFLEYIDLDPSGGFINKRRFGSAILGDLKWDFRFERFDTIAAGIQRHFEHLVSRWVEFWGEKTGIRTAVFGGGCFMNVKCNMLISELNGFDRVFFSPGAGDESTALGAAYAVAGERGERAIRPLESLHTGPRFDDDAVERELEEHGDSLAWEKCRDVEERVTGLLAEGNIVGRFRGPAEWGARALGGRSILCRADDPRIIQRLNKSIKSRDFWMPFAPAIIEEDADRYLVNPKGLSSPFMTLTFHTTVRAFDEIAAALHPYDLTCRPQLVNKDTSPDFHRLLVLFRELTGLSGLLNTSFNLHGSPIVGSPRDALRTLLDSGLDYAAIEGFLVWRKPVGGIEATG